jgi:hypothetical protein
MSDSTAQRSPQVSQTLCLLAWQNTADDFSERAATSITRFLRQGCLWPGRASPQLDTLKQTQLAGNASNAALFSGRGNLNLYERAGLSRSSTKNLGGQDK